MSYLINHFDIISFFILFICLFLIFFYYIMMKMQNKSKNVYSSWSLICESGYLGTDKLYLGDAQAANNMKFIHDCQIMTVLSVGE